ncbi:MAG: membrane dipeptidase [Pirellulales bacterium]
MFVFDAHLDLSMSAMEWNRDLREPVAAIRQREQGRTDKLDRGKNTVAFPEMRRGDVGLCVATQIARYVRPGNPLPGWHSPEIAWAQTQGQLAWYRAMEAQGHLRQITDRDQLDAHVELWMGSSSGESLSDGTPKADAPIGYILSLEGADSILTPGHLERSYRDGLRALGPAHYGPGTYAQGTAASGGLGPDGRELLAEMERLGIILDATHLCDESFWEALEHFGGHVWASHSNCRAVPDGRQFSDEQMLALIERAVVGAALDAWMLVPGWRRGATTPEETGVALRHVVDQIDHVCQLAGNARHSGIGTDLDGGFGREQAPLDLDTIVDLQKIAEQLVDRGYPTADVEAIMHGNWIRFLRDAWG